MPEPRPYIDVEALVGALAQEVAKELRDLRQRVASLETRQAKCLVYRGVYQRADQYQRGDAATHGGQLWVATKDTSSTPGASADWQLAAKGNTK